MERLEKLAGASGVITDPMTLEFFSVDGVLPVVVARPGSAEEITEVVRFAAAEKLAMIPVGGRTKLSIGMPPQRYDIALDMSRMNHVLAYDPGDLTLGAEAGIGVEKLLELLEEKNQFLPLLVPWMERATIGGIMATNSVSPLRFAYGGPREFLLGMEFVTGEGKLCKSGGRVVKNVTGYDLHKLMIGSLGTLGVITRVNFKTFPLPLAQQTFVAAYANAREAMALVQAIAKSPLSPRVVEVVDPAALPILGSNKLPAGMWSVIIAAAGNEKAVERHHVDLARMARDSAAEAFQSLTDEEKRMLLGRLREFVRHVQETHPEATIFRISALPTTIAGLMEQLAAIAKRMELASCSVVRAGSMIYFALWRETGESESNLKRACGEIFAAVEGVGGWALIEWCPTEQKRQVNVWGTPRGDFELMKRMKKVFDPAGILSPGRFVGGI